MFAAQADERSILQAWSSRTSRLSRVSRRRTLLSRTASTRPPTSTTCVQVSLFHDKPTHPCFLQYTIVWNAKSSQFYVDGKLRKTFTKNVPQIGASFIWNA